MLVVILIYLGAAVLGVALARTPLARPGYWRKWGVLIAALLAALLLPLALDEKPQPGAIPLPLTTIWLLMLGFIVFPIAIVAAFLWQARRMIDAAGAKWWALLGVAPGAFIVIGALSSRDVKAMKQKNAVDVFR